MTEMESSIKHLDFVSQVQRFLEKNQRDTRMTPVEAGEMGEGCKQEAEDRPPSLGDMTDEERKSKRTEIKSAVEENKETVEEETSISLYSLEAETRTCTQPSTSSNSALWTMDSKSDEEEEQEEEQPGRQLPCLEIPEFLLPDPPEGSRGKCCICQMMLIVLCLYRCSAVGA